MTIKKICFVATIPKSLAVFLSDVIQKTSKQYTVKIISSPLGREVLDQLNAEYIPLPIERKPSLLKDLITLFQLFLIFRKEKFDLVHSITPKAGLLTMLAAFVTRIPVRTHTFTGQVWLNTYGVKRVLLKYLDKLLVFCATDILVDSPSQRDFLVNEGILKKNRAVVIGHGSICGVDLNVFSFDYHARMAIRESLKLDDNSIVILYMARLTKQKGILELAEAFERIASIKNNVFLYVIGPEEDVSFEEVAEKCKNYNNKVLRLEYTSNPAEYLSASDIFCLPSHMEGFGQVLVNASSCSIPIVASRIYGITDAVEDGVTGLLYPAGDIDVLTNTLIKLIDDKELRKKMGRAGRDRVIKHFDQNLITAEIVAFYNDALA